MRIARGIQNKVREGMAMAKPVIVSPPIDLPPAEVDAVLVEVAVTASVAPPRWMCRRSAVVA